MTTAQSEDAKASAALQLLTLEQAAEIAHQRLTGNVLTNGEDVIAKGLSAMALSMVAPIYERDKASGEDRIATAHAINERLFRPVREKRPQRIKGFFMRADDLENAVELLKTANIEFRPEGLKFGK